jgi:hypothetical protein
MTSWKFAAFVGMTSRGATEWVPAFAGMTIEGGTTE